MRYVLFFAYIFTSLVASGLHVCLWYSLRYWPGIGPWAVLKEYGAALLYGLSWPVFLVLHLFNR